MQDLNPTLGAFGFPDQFVSKEQKDTEEYGKRYALAIWYSFGGEFQYNERRLKMISLRKWREGKQSVDEMKDIITDGDTAFLNIDWSPISIIPKFVDIMTSMINNSLYKVKCNAVDKVSLNKKDKEKRKLEAAIYLKKLQDKLQIPLVPEGMKVPKDMDEVNLYMGLNFKQATEIAMELGIDKVFAANKFKEIRRQIVDDLVTIKTGAARCYYDRNYTIKTRYVDPVNLITPYSLKEDYSDIPYAAEVVWKTIGQIKAEAGSKFSEEQYYDIATSVFNRWGNLITGGLKDYYYYHNTDQKPYYNFLIPCLDFEFLTINTTYYKTKTNKFGTKRTYKSTANYKPESPDTEVFSTDKQDRYCGIYILGTDFIYNYGLGKNLPREKKAGRYSLETNLSFRIYSPGMRDMENKSMVERAVPYARQMQLAHLKLQQMQASAAPKGLKIDISGLQEVIIGKGNQKESFTPLELRAMHRQTGTFYYNRTNTDGSPMNGSPIEEIENGLGKDVPMYINIYNHNLNIIRDMIGVNEAVDASTPSPEALVGIQKMAAVGTKNAMRPLSEALTFIVENVAREVTIMIQDSIEYNKENIELSLGSATYDILKLGSDIPLCEYSIEVEYMPDEEERAFLEQRIVNAEMNKEIRPEDAIMCHSIKNTKEAAAYLIERRKAYQAERIAESQAQSQAQAAAAAQAAKVAEEEKRNTVVIEGKAKAELMMVERDMQLKIEAEKHRFEMERLNTEMAWKLQIAQSNQRQQQTSDLRK